MRSMSTDDRKSGSTRPHPAITFIEPMYARQVQVIPEGDDWLYEVKLDGYRCLAGNDSAGVTLWSRRGNLFTDQFPQITRACARLAPGTLLDGEIVAIDENGRVSFNLLQNRRSGARAVLFFAFDVLVCRGRSLLRLPLSERREILQEIFEGQAPGALALSEVLDADPATLIRVVKEFGFEGIIAKRRDSCYEPGKRDGAWLKYKVNKAQEFVIGGYTGGDPVDALIVGCYEGDKLMYASKVRNGFVPDVRRDVSRVLRDLRSDVCPFANLPEKKRTMWALTRDEMKNCCWIRPELVAQIEFTDWTSDGHLRAAKFVALRDDKEPRLVVRESGGERR